MAVIAAAERARQVEAPGIAGRGPLLHGRAARIGQAEELRRLVEGLAQRIVEGGPVAAVTADLRDAKRLGVAARDQQHR